MSQDHLVTPSHVGKRRRFVPVAWGTSALAAAVLLLGVNGTLSTWTTAVINNDTNTVATAKAVILKETNSAGTVTCYSNANATNSSTCSTINKYGGITVPLTPGATPITIDVLFSNAGTGNGTSFSLLPGTCTQTPTANATPPVINNICTNGDLTVAMTCNKGATVGANPAWTDLAYTAGAPSAFGAATTLSHTAAAGDLNVAAPWACRFTLALNTLASPSDSNIVVSQPLQWTLNG